jgi:hypothetical protein
MTIGPKYGEEAAAWEQVRHREEALELKEVPWETMRFWRLVAHLWVSEPVKVTQWPTHDTIEVMGVDSEPCMDLEGRVTPEGIMLREFYTQHEFQNRRVPTKPGGYVAVEALDVVEADTSELLADLVLLEKMQDTTVVDEAASLAHHYEVLVERVQRCFRALYEQSERDSMIKKVVDYFRRRLAELDPILIEPIPA